MGTKVYYYPPANRRGFYTNPYSVNYKKALESNFDLLDKDNNPSLAPSLSFLLFSFRADIYICNWLESVCFLPLGLLQYVFVRLGLWVIKLRKKEIVWMYHNIHPHQGENSYSKKIQEILYERATLIISHSFEAAEYAKQRAKGKVLYINHPIKRFDLSVFNKDVKDRDVLIWGEISPYKGIVEFLQEYNKRQSTLSVHIIGECKSSLLEANIKQLSKENILFENRRASFEELAMLIKHAKCVLFPYKGGSISSSGALIDTIALGGLSIGPNKGAFKDLAEYGVCHVYDDYDSLFSLLGNIPQNDIQVVEKFIEENSWEAFAKRLNKLIK